MNITILSSNSQQAKALATLIKARGLNLTRVVHEVSQPKNQGSPNLREQVSKTINSSKLLTSLKDYIKYDKKTRIALNTELRSKENADNYLKAHLATLNTQHPLPGVEYLEVSNINSPTLIDEFTQNPPDVCVVWGTSIISKEVIALVKHAIVNAHTSVLPEYRGTRSEFWQCYHEDYSHVGFTIHLIDKGVDTGNIIYQKKLEDMGLLEPYNLRARNIISILENYPRVVKQFINGELKPFSQPAGSSPTYRFKDITLEKRVELYNRIAQNVAALS